jgi:archaellum biogenesis ATPase FlaH
MTKEAVQADEETIRAHLRHITRRWSELDAKCVFEIRFLTAEDKATVKNIMRYSPDEMGLEMASDHIASMNKHKLNAYVVVNPVRADANIKTGKAATDEHIAASFFHWADADDAQAAENIRQFVGPRPTFFVLTGTQPCARPHVYWELEEPTLNMAAWTSTQKAIATTLKSDSSVVNPSRIMRVAGTVNWPKPKKIAKGYVQEVTTLRIYDEDDRPLVTSDRMARAFTGHADAPENADSVLHIDTGEARRTADEYADILHRARTDGEKHTGVRDLTASLAGQGVSRALTEAIVKEACPVWDDGVVKLIDTAYDKFFQPADEPQPVEATPQTIQDFPISDSAGFLADLKPLEYLIDGLLPVGVAYSLTGYPGHGKTTLALQFGLSVARGEMFSGRDTSKGRVLVLAGENPYNVKWQYAAALAAQNLNPQDVDIHFVEGRFSIKEWSDVLRAKIEAMPDLKLIIVDSLQAFFEGDNDNDNTQMVEMAHKLRKLCDVPQRPAILIIAHPAGKVPSKDNLVPRGGGAFLAEIDGNLTVWSQDASQQTLHHSQKFRGAGFEPMEWVMQVHEFGHLTDIHGTPLKLPVSRPETVAERTSREIQSDGLLRQWLMTVDAEQPLSVREGAQQFGVSRYRMEQLIKTAKEEKLIKRHAKTWRLTQGGTDFLEANDAGM